MPGDVPCTSEKVTSDENMRLRMAWSVYKRERDKIMTTRNAR